MAVLFLLNFFVAIMRNFILDISRLIFFLDFVLGSDSFEAKVFIFVDVLVEVVDIIEVILI